MKFILPTTIFSLLLATGLATGGVAGTMSQAEPQATIWQVSNKGRCMNDCAGAYEACKRRVEVEGNKQGWDGDLRQDAHDQRCVPAKSACLRKC